MDTFLRLFNSTQLFFSQIGQSLHYIRNRINEDYPYIALFIGIFLILLEDIVNLMIDLNFLHYFVRACNYVAERLAEARNYLRIFINIWTEPICALLLLAWSPVAPYFDKLVEILSSQIIIEIPIPPGEVLWRWAIYFGMALGALEMAAAIARFAIGGPDAPRVLIRAGSYCVKWAADEMEMDPEVVDRWLDAWGIETNCYSLSV